MTVKEYLNQARLLDEQIDRQLKESEHLRDLACSLRSPTLGSCVQTSPKNESTFAQALERVMEMEERVNSKIDQLVALKNQIQTVIDTLPDWEERLLLQLRYLERTSWAKIGAILHADRTTVYRRHNRALSHVVLPENPIKI